MEHFNYENLKLPVPKHKYLINEEIGGYSTFLKDVISKEGLRLIVIVVIVFLVIRPFYDTLKSIVIDSRNKDGRVKDYWAFKAENPFNKIFIYSSNSCSYPPCIWSFNMAKRISLFGYEHSR